MKRRTFLQFSSATVAALAASSTEIINFFQKHMLQSLPSHLLLPKVLLHKLMVLMFIFVVSVLTPLV